MNIYILKKICPSTKLPHWLAMIEYKITNCDIYRSRTQRNPLPVTNFVTNSFTYLSKTWWCHHERRMSFESHQHCNRLQQTKLISRLSSLSAPIWTIKQTNEKNVYKHTYIYMYMFRSNVHAHIALGISLLPLRVSFFPVSLALFWLIHMYCTRNIHKHYCRLWGGFG